MTQKINTVYTPFKHSTSIQLNEIVKSKRQVVIQKVLCVKKSPSQKARRIKKLSASLDNGRWMDADRSSCLRKVGNVENRDLSSSCGMSCDTLLYQSFSFFFLPQSCLHHTEVRSSIIIILYSSHSSIL